MENEHTVRLIPKFRATETDRDLTIGPTPPTSDVDMLTVTSETTSDSNRTLSLSFQRANNYGTNWQLVNLDGIISETNLRQSRDLLIFNITCLYIYIYTDRTTQKIIFSALIR